ncbi:MAG: hypothetical protein WC781_00130 [Candidatus Pacearchaeota archaeon]
MAKSSIIGKLGGWAFLAGVLIALIVGIFNLSADPIWVLVLVLIGLVVGFLNITGKEAMPFLLSGAVLVIVSSQGNALLNTVPYLSGVFVALLAIFVPATIIVAIRNVWGLAKN